MMLPFLKVRSFARSSTTALGLIGIGSVLALATAMETGCSSTLAQPFQNLKSQPITIHRLQNFEPPAPQAGAPAIPGMPALPPQIQQWLGGAAAALPPGLIPPGLLPGTAPAPTDGPRFYNFRILGTMTVADQKTRDEILDLFGKESNFQTPRQTCMYAEFGFQIGQAGPPGQPAASPTGGAPADILVSLSCEQVQMFNYGWPYGTKTGLTADTNSKIMAIVRRSFGG